jgi:hypothetical protein
MKQKGAPVDWYAIEPAIGAPTASPSCASPRIRTPRRSSPTSSSRPRAGDPREGRLRARQPEAQRSAQKLPLKFVDPAAGARRERQVEEALDEIVLGTRE